MDAYLALYAVFGLMQVCAWLEDNDETSLRCGGMFLFSCLGLKNEATLIILSALLALSAALLLRGQKKFIASKNQVLRRAILFLVPISSKLLWTRYLKRVGAANDLNLGANSIPTMVSRIGNPSIVISILKSTLGKGELRTLSFDLPPV